MLGAIVGDVIGSVYEAAPIKTTSFPLFTAESTFTDDTVLTVAIADAMLQGTDYGEALRRFGRRYPDAGYGGSFHDWLCTDHPAPYNSWGNGAAMRVSPVGLAGASLEEVLREAHRSAEVTHNHPEGIKGAQATAAAVYLARIGVDKARIGEALTQRFGYDLNRRLDDIRPGYRFDVSCQGSVPESIIAFLEADDFEGAVRNAVSLGGDSDTMACIAGAIAQAFYRHIPAEVMAETRTRLPDELLAVVDAFERAHPL
jgi:ADP-ribosylglycohydrolase